MGYLGVRRLLREDLWSSQLKLPSGRSINLGYYSSEIKAAKAYDSALMKLNGLEVARNQLNFPDEQGPPERYQTDPPPTTRFARKERPPWRSGRDSNPLVRQFGHRIAENSRRVSAPKVVRPTGVYIPSIKFTGVRLFKPSGLYQASIQDAFGGTIILGSYVSEMQAARAYDIAALKVFGKDASTNFCRGEYPNLLLNIMVASDSQEWTNDCLENMAISPNKLVSFVRQYVLSEGLQTCWPNSTHRMSGSRKACTRQNQECMSVEADSKRRRKCRKPKKSDRGYCDINWCMSFKRRGYYGLYNLPQHRRFMCTKNGPEGCKHKGCN